MTEVKNQRTKAVMMVFGLCHQTVAWLRFARDLGYMSRDFKYDSKLLNDFMEKFMHRYGAMEEEVYEHSIQISDLFERIAKLDETDIRRIDGLLTKIERNPSKSRAVVNQ